MDSGGVIVNSRAQPNGRVKANLLDALWKTARLARDHRRRRVMGAAGREAWQEHFTWEKLAADYLELYAGGAAR